MEREPDQVWTITGIDYTGGPQIDQLRIYQLFLESPGYRIEAILDDIFYWHTGVFPDLEQAIAYGLNACTECNVLGYFRLGGRAIEDFLPLTHDLGEEELYRGWFVCDCCEVTDGNTFAFDPLTNRLYVRKTVEEAKALIDQMEIRRYVAPGQLALIV